VIGKLKAKHIVLVFFAYASSFDSEAYAKKTGRRIE